MIPRSAPEHAPPRARVVARAGRTWNRKLHVYLGLYFLLFIWIFSISGFLLNHTGWESASFWQRRVETTEQHTISPILPSEDIPAAREVMRQLSIAGEINDVTWTPDSTRVKFQVVRPGQVFTVDADARSGKVTLARIDLDTWGVLDALHKFSGVSMTNPTRERDWALTFVWSISMDALALGLITLVFSGIYLWYRLPGKRFGGLVALTAGLGSSGFFLFGLLRYF